MSSLAAVATGFASLLGRLAELAKLRDDRLANHFDRYVAPCFADAERVFQDYDLLFSELIDRIEKAQTTEELLEWLEARRGVGWPTREKMRAVVTGQALRRDAMSDFECGVSGILRGSASVVESGHTDMIDFGWGDHTVKDLLEHWRDQPLSSNRQRMLENAKGQREALRRAWTLATKGYASLQQQLVDRKPPRVKKA